MKINLKPQVSQEQQEPAVREIRNAKIATSIVALAVSSFSFYCYSDFSNRACQNNYFSFSGNDAMCAIVKITTGLTSISALALSVIIWLPKNLESSEHASNVNLADQRLALKPRIP